MNIETNGTILPPNGVDWICVSPKAGSKTLLKEGNEIKIVYISFKRDISKIVKNPDKKIYLETQKRVRGVIPMFKTYVVNFV